PVNWATVALDEAVFRALPRRGDQVLRRKPLGDSVQFALGAPAHALRAATALVVAGLADDGTSSFKEGERLDFAGCDRRQRRVVLLAALVGERGQGPGRQGVHGVTSCGSWPTRRLRKS